MTDVVVASLPDCWEARAGSRPVGTLHAVTMPDGRCFVTFLDCRDDAYGPLLAAADLDRDLYARADEATLDRYTRLGFGVHRVEHYYRLPTDPARHGLTDTAPPPGVDLVSAADADLDRLRELDDAVRQDVPGSAGWRWEPADFRDETFGPGFDPATYLVAVERSGGAYLGLVRVWMNPGGPRLGCLAVLPAFRRTRLTRALVGAVARTLHQRGHAEVVTEIDATNRAATTLATRRGAVLTRSMYELVLRRHKIGP